MHVMAELGYLLIYQVKKCLFENVILEKKEKTTTDKRWLSRIILFVFNLNVLF